jgi:hypothetical protein
MGDEDITRAVDSEGSLPLDLEDKTTEPNLPPLPDLPDLPEKKGPIETAKKFVTDMVNAGKRSARSRPKTTAAGTAVAVLVIAYGLSGPGDMKGEPPHVQVAISEHFKNPVRFVGGPLKVGAEKVPTVFGESVIYESIPQEAVCSVVFKAAKSKVGLTANPVLTFPVWWMTPGSFPLLIQESSADGYALWWATFQGNGCLAIADRAEFIGSDIHQLILHPKGRQVLLQKTKDSVKDAKGQAIHAVPFLDPQASSDDEVWFPYSLAGRDDLNFAHADGVHPRKRKEQE